MLGTKVPTKSGTFGMSGKKAVDLLIANGTVLTMNQQKDIIEKGAVAVQDGEIVAVGLMGEIEQKYTAKKVIDAGGQVVLPGLINAHTHASMIFFRGFADDLLLMDWLHALFPEEKEHVTRRHICCSLRYLRCPEIL